MSIQRGNPRQRSGNRNQQRFAIQALPAPSVITSANMVVDPNVMQFTIAGSPVVLSSPVTFLTRIGGLPTDHTIVSLEVVSDTLYAATLSEPIDGYPDQIEVPSAQNGWRNINGGLILADFKSILE